MDPVAFTVERNSGRALAVDVFRPERNALNACVILLHGGAWSFGDRRDVHPYARALVKQGFTAIAAEYRLLGEAAWPAQLDDVKDVVVWARAQAERLGYARENIALQGFSAGAHLALLAAATSGDTPNGEAVAGEPVGAVIALFAPAQLSLPAPGAPPDPVSALLGPAATRAKANAASPLAHIGPRLPPTCLLHGTADALIPYQSSVALFDALETAGVPVELHLLQGQNHEFSALPSLLPHVQDVVALFLKRTLVDPAFYEAENKALNPFANGPPGAPPAH